MCITEKSDAKNTVTVPLNTAAKSVQDVEAEVLVGFNSILLLLLNFAS